MITRTRTRRDQPASFTLIELLVVIAILTVLFALTSAAVMRIWGTGPRTKTRVEIGQFETALRSAMSEMNVEWVPSVLLLKQTYKTPTAATTQLEKDSFAFLQKMFGKNAMQLNVAYNWGGNVTAKQDQLLHGPQCLVFILGGMQTSAGGNLGCLGFAKGNNPTAVGGQRYGPYFDFNAARLKQDTATGFFFYLDPYGMPYMFLSRGPAGQETFDLTTVYTKVTDSPVLPLNSAPTMLSDGTNTYDLSSGVVAGKPAPVSPYISVAGSANNATQFMNQKFCQILSAGENKKFGPGGAAWTPTAGYKGLNDAGNDDLSNFSKSPLAIGSN